MRKYIIAFMIVLLSTGAQAADPKRIYEYTTLAAPADADAFLISDTSASNREYKLLLSGLVTYLQTGLATTFAPILGADDNYVTDAEKIVIGNTSGTNTGDQTSVTGNAGTATALAANGTNCSAGQAALGVDASGNAEGCFSPAGSGDMVLASAQSVTGAKTFDSSTLLMKATGANTGVTTFANANASANNYTVTLPATTGTVALTSQLFNPAAPGAIGGTTPAAGTFTTVTATTYATSAADGARKSELPNNTSATPTGGGVEEIYNEGGQIKVVEADTEYDLLHSGNLDDTPADNDTASAPTSNALVDGLAGKQAADGDLDDLADGALTASKVSGSAVTTASKSTTYTIGTDSANESYGGTIYVTSATTITAPAVATGMNFTVVTIGDIAVSLDVNASDKMILDGVTLADGDKATNSSKAGDTITCQYYSADGFYCWSGTVLGGHWTDGN